MKLISCLTLMLIIAGACLAQTQKNITSFVEATKSIDEKPNLVAIRKGSDSFTEAFNKHDAKAIALMWTTDGEYSDEFGNVFSGRENIQKTYSEFFESNPQAKISITIDSLRMLSDNSAIESGHTMVVPVMKGSSGASRYTAFHVKVDGKWKMAMVRDTQIHAPLSCYNLKDLDWLIGLWGAEENGVKLESNSNWIANNTFIERRYKASHLDGSVSEGLQIIGWNPYEGHIQSWDFSSEGGNAVGIWTPIENGWAAQIQGVAGDGSHTSAVNYLIRLDDNAYVWRSTNRTRAGFDLPEADEIVIRRTSSVK